MRSRVLLAALLAAATSSALPAPPLGSAIAATSAAAPRSGAPRLLSVGWADGGSPVTGATATLAVALAAGRPTTLRVDVGGGVVDAIPRPCAPSTVVQRRSRLVAEGAVLVCVVTGRRPLDLRVDVRPAAGPGSLGARVEEGGQVREAAPLPVAAGRADTPRTLRLVSSPDFLNADVADPPGPARGTNRAYERALDRVLDDWAAQQPDGVLVAGDLVNGRWDRDDRRRRVFGPVRTLAEQRRAVRRAAATYYPAYLRRFREHGLEVFPAIGDHEYGDNPWPAGKRRLAPTFAREFARHLVRGRFPDHPRGRHAATAYAWRPSPDVQVVSTDPFDITAGRARLRLDRPQLRWLERVLRRAQRDGVRWTLVQGHVPVLEPVRARGSSELRYAGGARSRLWRAFERYGVDLYLCGEVHDTTASSHGGVVQLAHGGAFQYGLTTYARLDVHEDRLEVALEDLDVRVGFRGPHLWETARGGLPARLRVAGSPYGIGTLTIGADGTLSRRSGILLPYRHGG